MTETQKKRPAQNRDWWGKHLESCEQSGMSMVEYAKQNDINLGNFCSWKAKLKTKSESDSAKRQKHNTKHSKEASKSEELQFVEVSLRNKQSDMVEFAAPNGWSIRIPAQMEPKTINKFIAILEQRI